jgi:hypothetical protein
MKNMTGKFVLGALILALVLAALPTTTTFAAGLDVGTKPPAPGAVVDPAVLNARLESVFARQQERVGRIGKAVDNFDKMTANVQKLIDRAGEKGLDVAAVQSAFNAFKDAFPKGQPIYAKAKSITDGHAGFDAAGKVTNAETAKSTVKSLADTLKEYRSTVGEFFKALREAVKAFREANPRPTPGATPTHG